MEQKTTDQRLADVEIDQQRIEKRLAQLEAQNVRQAEQIDGLQDYRNRHQRDLASCVLHIDQLRAELMQLQRRLHLLEITGTGQNIMLRFKDSTGAVRLEVGVDATDCPIIKAVGQDGAAVLGVTPGGIPHVAVGRNGRIGFCAMADADGTANLQLKSYRGR